MDVLDLSILLIAAVIASSGIWINIQKGRHKSDDMSLWWFRILVPLALLGSLGLYFGEWGYALTGRLRLLPGYLLVAGGLWLRWRAVKRLGAAFTVGLQVRPEQVLVTDGVYRRLRHPSYTGLLLYYLGLGLVMGNLWSLALLLVFPLLAVLLRVRREERLLSAHFGEDYQAYRERSWCLLPGLY